MKADTSLVWSFARTVIPYPDYRQRLCVRRSARALIGSRSWPQSQTLPVPLVPGVRIAELCLLRLLMLQRDVRRSVRAGHVEASGLLARASVDTCIVGLYCIHVPEASQRFDANSVKSLYKLLGPVMDPAFFPEVLVTRMFDKLSQPKQLPTAKDMAEAVKAATGQTIASDLYHRLYEPLSMLFVHSGPISLLRHVTARGRVVDQPWNPWTRLAMLRTADACVGILAGALAEKSGSPSQTFFTYANKHWQRALIPLVVVTVRHAGGSVRWSEVPSALRQFRQLGRYYRSGEAAAEPRDVREARIREGLHRILSTLGPAVEGEMLDVMAEVLAELLAEAPPSGAPAA